MIKSLRKMLMPRSRFISVINMNDVYLQTTADIANALGMDLAPNPNRKRSSSKVFVIDFKGDVFAKQAHGLSQEVTAVLAAIDPKNDEVLVRVESAGGAVHSYGYAASQIDRLKKAGIRTTISVDRIAASGGYMMACVADRIISAPFAIVGSIGVVAELPNFNKMITNLGIDYKQYTAGEFKRTISTWAPITEEGEQKFVHDLHETYDLFKRHVVDHRPSMNIDALATGEHWYGTQALDRGLVDEIKTSDEWLLEKMLSCEVLKVAYMADKPWGERMKGAVVATFEGLFYKALSIWTHMRFVG